MMHVAFEIPADRFAGACWGGIETALWHLSAALRETGVAVSHVSEHELPDDDAFEALVAARAFDAVFPLGDRVSFANPDSTRWPALVRRMIRIWHDVRPLSPGCETPGRCDAHPGPGCPAAKVAPDAPIQNVFVGDAEWTRCFQHRHVIPWSVGHVPRATLRDPRGPILVLAGKIPNTAMHRLVHGLRAAGHRVRVIASNWTRDGRRLNEVIGAPDPGVEVVRHYDIRRDAARVFGGTSCLVALSGLPGDAPGARLGPELADALAYARAASDILTMESR
jgi:hypothetical protein